MRILALSPHPDDVVLGAGGFLFRASRTPPSPGGTAIRVIRFSMTSQVVGDEDREALMGLTAPMPLTFGDHDFPVRFLAEHRHAVRDAIYDAVSVMEPDVVLIPSSTDVHQDHQVVHEEAVRVCRDFARNILGYDIPWNTRVSGTMTAPFGLDAMGAKERAIKCYRSQEHRRYMAPGVMRAIAVAAAIRGHVEPFAESFEVIHGRFF